MTILRKCGHTETLEVGPGMADWEFRREKFVGRENCWDCIIAANAAALRAINAARRAEQAAKHTAKPIAPIVIVPAKVEEVR